MVTYRHRDGGPRIREEEQLLYASADVRVGVFDARLDDPHFRFSAVPSQYLVVFPLTSARIEHSGEAGFVADRTLVTFYDPGQVYRRSEVSTRGDRAHWFALSPALARELLCGPGAGDPAATRPTAPEGPPRFGFRRGPSDAASYRLQDTLVRRLTEGALHPREVEAAVRALVRRLIAAARRAAAREARTGGKASELAERARELLARRYAEALRLEEIAEELDCSSSHLSHTFRGVTGSSLHAHRDQLRVRKALAELGEHRGRLTELGLELGYSSHSHFTERFRRAFGEPPTAL